jgi:hypothetical protein
MAMTHQPVFPQTPNTAALDIENGDGTTVQTLLTAGSNGAKVASVSAISDDTADKTLTLYVNDALLGEVLVLDGSGTNGTDKAVSVLNATDLPWLPDDLAITLKAGDILKIGVKVAVTAAKKIQLCAFYGDY